MVTTMEYAVGVVDGNDEFSGVESDWGVLEIPADGVAAIVAELGVDIPVSTAVPGTKVSP